MINQYMGVAPSFFAGGIMQISRVRVSFTRRLGACGMVDGGYDSKFIRMGLLAGTELFVAQGGIEKGLPSLKLTAHP